MPKKRAKRGSQIKNSATKRGGSPKKPRVSSTGSKAAKPQSNEIPPSQNPPKGAHDAENKEFDFDGLFQRSQPPPRITLVRGDIFKFSPRECDACALWVPPTGYNRITLDFGGFINRLRDQKVDRLVGDHWDNVQVLDRNLWRNPLGCLLRIRHRLDQLKYVYFWPNPNDSFLETPNNARPMVMAALELLTNLGATRVSMNGIQGNEGQGHSTRADEIIRDVMVKAVEDWVSGEGTGEPRIFLAWIFARNIRLTLIWHNSA